MTFSEDSSWRKSGKRFASHNPGLLPVQRTRAGPPLASSLIAVP
jgi:hypothetical protein